MFQITLVAELITVIQATDATLENKLTLLTYEVDIMFVIVSI